MGFPDKPTASVMKKKVRRGWAVLTYNLDGVALQERNFASEAEADAWVRHQYQLIREEKQ